MATTERCKPAGKRTYRFTPVPFDFGTRIEPGTLVYKTQPYGCPGNGAMGQCYVADAETGAFLQMVCLNSLKPEGTL